MVDAVEPAGSRQAPLIQDARTLLELAMIHRPGLAHGKQDLGRILEAMLYYDRVHLMMSAQMFTGLWDALGPDDLDALITHPSVTTTLTPEMLAIKNDVGSSMITHRSVAFKVSGRAGRIIDDKDDAGSLLQMIGGLPNRPEGTWAQVNRIVRKTSRSRYAKILGGEAESRERFLSLVRDEATLKLFVVGWAIANGERVDEAALRRAKISAIEVGEEVMIASDIPLEAIVSGWNSRDTWGAILSSVQDYGVDLYLSNAYGADIVTDPAVAEVAGARLDLSLNRARRNRDEISAFEAMVFEEAHAFADSINRGLITFSEALTAVDESRRFRTWTRGIAPDASLIAEYHRAISKETILDRLPASVARFAIFNGAGMLAGCRYAGNGSDRLRH